MVAANRSAVCAVGAVEWLGRMPAIAAAEATHEQMRAADVAHGGLSRWGIGGAAALAPWQQAVPAWAR